MERKKKTFVLTAVVTFVCFIVMTSHASQTITIGDFEGPGNAQFDGWTAYSSSITFLAGDDVGLTWSSTGNGSAAINFTGGFHWAIQLDDIILAQLADNTGLLMIDTHLITTNWGDDDWAQFNTVALNSAIGWHQTPYELLDDPINPTFPGSWQTGYMSPRTLTWDFSTLLEDYTPQDIIDGDGVNDPWAHLNFSVNSSEGTSGTFYIDNIRIILGDGETDTDNDGFPDETDNCPETPNPNQDDFDEDDAGDVCDPDDDNDGVLDEDDYCQFEDSTGQDANGDGCIDEIETLPDVVEELELSNGLENSFLNKTEDIQDSIDAGSTQQAINQLNAFINQVEAQRGKKLTDEEADMLIEYATNLLNSLSSP